MGKGDKKTRRGKIVRGSYGVRRMRKCNTKNTTTSAFPVSKPMVIEDKPKVAKPAPKKAVAEKASGAKKPAIKKTAAKPAVAKKPATPKKKEVKKKE